MSLRGQEQLVALRPCGRGLVLEVLRYADEVNKAANYLPRRWQCEARRRPARSRRNADRQEIGAFDASDYHNHYIDALKRVIAKKAKAKGKRVLEDVEEPASAGRGSNVIDLMAALKASVDGKKTAPAKAAPAKKAPARKALARKRA